VMAGLYDWLHRTWSSVLTAAELSVPDTQTDDPGFLDPCHLYSDRLQEELVKVQQQNQLIGELLDQFWNCRDQHQPSGFEAAQNARKSIDGAKLLLATAANRVRQVIDEIEIVTQQQATE
jgi:hypothetical protein